LSALKGTAVEEMKQAYLEKASEVLSLSTKEYNDESKTFWSVDMVAIDPTRQGKGHGKELLQIFCDLADAAVVPCDLESASQRNTQFYQRAGFGIQSTLTILDPTQTDGGIPLKLSLMRRWPVTILPFHQRSLHDGSNTTVYTTRSESSLLRTDVFANLIASAKGRRFYSTSAVLWRGMGGSMASTTRTTSSNNNKHNPTVTTNSTIHSDNNDVVRIVELSAANANDLRHPKHFVTILNKDFPGGWKREPYSKHQNASSTNNNGRPDDTTWRNFVYQNILKHFLPAQYPDSVADGYASYAKYSFAASVAGSAAMVLSTQTLLLAVGVVGSSPAGGSTGQASIMAGALNWVLKDGAGQLGGVLYASFLGRTRRFDANPKRWRMMAALCLDLGTLLEILSPYVVSTTPSTGSTNWVLPLACFANILKNIGFLTASASRASLHQSMCLRANLGDITAKAGSQATAAGLCGTSLGIGISTLLSSSASVETYVGFFCLLSVLHQVGNYLSVQSVPLTHFNNQRLSIVLKTYCSSILQRKETRLPLENDKALTPQQVAAQESFLPWVSDTQTDCPWLVIGAKLSSLASSNGGGSELRLLFQVLSGQEYLVNRDKDGIVYVTFSTAAKGEDILKGMYHAHVLHHFGTIDSVEFNNIDNVAESLKIVESHLPVLMDDLHDKGWRLDSESFIIEPPQATRYVVQT
jgi:hypothetical protein